MAIGVGENLAEQTTRVWTGQQDSIHWEQTLGAAVSGGLLGHATVGVGRAFHASRSAVARTAVLGVGTGFAGAAGDAVTQLGAMAAGRQEGFDLTRSGLAFAGGALGGALGQAAYDKTCFAADTPLIARHEQGWRRADEIRVDDYLASRDEHDPLAPVVWNRVEEVFVAQGEIWELEWQGRTIRTTAEHPFYVYQLGWTPARELKPGMLLATMDGRYLPLTALASTGKVETVYNFRIAEGHTYFVGKPDWDAALWAHNACDSRALGQSLIDAGKKGRKGLQAAHVVPTGDFSNRSLEVRSAIKKARSAIEFAGIEINSASNGFWARAGHKGTHRDKYFLELGSILSKARASGKQEIITALEKIRQNAEAGVYRGKNYKR